MARGRLYFRVIEQDTGSWACRRGRDDIDDHPTLQEAVDHMAALAAQHRPSEVLVHHRDGRVESAALLT